MMSLQNHTSSLVLVATMLRWRMKFYVSTTLWTANTNKKIHLMLKVSFVWLIRTIIANIWLVLKFIDLLYRYLKTYKRLYLWQLTALLNTNFSSDDFLVNFFSLFYIGRFHLYDQMTKHPMSLDKYTWKQWQFPNSSQGNVTDPV